MARKFLNKQIVATLVGLTAGLSLIGLVTGCNESEWDSIDSIPVSHRLSSMDGAGEFEAYAKEAAKQYMRAQVEISRNQDAIWASEWGGIEVMVDEVANDSSSSDSDADGDADGDSGSNDFSETNTQEQGVDEADMVKTDGEYIYTLHKGQLIIVGVGESGAMETLSTLDVGGYANEMFVYNNKAVVFSTLNEQDVPSEIHYSFSSLKPDGDASSEPDMDVDCWEDGCYSGYAYSQIAILDLEDKANPSVVRTTIYAGQYATARRIDGSVRAVIHSPMYNLHMIWDYGNNVDWDDVESINKAYERMIDLNVAYFDSLTIEDIMPKKYDSQDGQATYIVAPNSIMAPHTPNGIGLQTVISLNLDTPESPSKASALFAERGIVYASKTSLYLTSARNYVSVAVESGLWSSESSYLTGLHKFDISDIQSAAVHTATGEVKGRLLDQFCLGEKDGYLRVATTTGNFWQETTLNNHVYILEQQSDALNIVGQLDDLGKGEEIYAARFVGDRGFLVTFFQQDPLYTLDLSDPTAPKSIGEWHGPGFSTYLHPWNDDKIISVGMEDWRVALSLYDVSDFSNPVLTERLYMGDDENSAAVYEHKAFTFNPETGYMALPYSSWYNTYQTGIRTFTVSNTGFATGASLNFFETEKDSNESEAQRSLYINDYMYGVSRCRLVSAPIANPADVSLSLQLFAGTSCEDWGSSYYW